MAAPCGAQQSTPAVSAAGGGRDAGALRADARQYRESHEAAILHEFSDLLALPNVAADRANIRRNADMLVAMLRKRGIEARLLELEGASTAV